MRPSKELPDTAASRETVHLSKEYKLTHLKVYSAAFIKTVGLSNRKRNGNSCACLCVPL